MQEHSKQFIFFSGLCLLTVVAGTLTHEMGHFLAAKSMGYKAYINYARTYYHPTPEQLSDGNLHKNAFLITAAGPLMTVLTGTTGLIILLVKRKKQTLKLSGYGWHWLLVFCALCWLRQPVNLATGTVKRLFDVNAGNPGDEVKLSKTLGLPASALGMLTAAAGLWVLYIVVFSILDKKIRSVFLSALIIGGALGYYLWLILIGPVVFP